jgi:aspartate/methionine/tyrosine aminotransferase
VVRRARHRADLRRDLRPLPLRRANPRLGRAFPRQPFAARRRDRLRVEDLGHDLAPKEIAASIASLQGHSTSNASSISQEAALAALRDPAQTDAAVEKMLREYDRRRRAMRDALQAIDGVRLCDPEGAFYVFPDVSQLYGPLSVAGSVDFCERLLTEAHVAAVPGEAFGVDGCVRFSFATPIDRVEEGMRRLAAWARGAAR